MATTPSSTRVSAYSPRSPPYSSSGGSNSSNSSHHSQASARAAVLGSLHTVGQTYDRKAQARAADLHSNAASIKKQEKQLGASTAALAKERAKWEKEIAKPNNVLKSCGDMENWYKMLENDFAVLDETLRLVEAGRRN